MVHSSLISSLTCYFLSPSFCSVVKPFLLASFLSFFLPQALYGSSISSCHMQQLLIFSPAECLEPKRDWLLTNAVNMCVSNAPTDLYWAHSFFFIFKFFIAWTSFAPSSSSSPQVWHKDVWATDHAKTLPAGGTTYLGVKATQAKGAVMSLCSIALKYKQVMTYSGYTVNPSHNMPFSFNKVPGILYEKNY